jgi:hypothetical protein
METDPVSETMLFLVFRISDDRQRKKKHSMYNLILKESENTEESEFQRVFYFFAVGNYDFVPREIKLRLESFYLALCHGALYQY